MTSFPHTGQFLALLFQRLFWLVKLRIVVGSFPSELLYVAFLEHDPNLPQFRDFQQSLSFSWGQFVDFRGPQFHSFGELEHFVEKSITFSKPVLWSFTGTSVWNKALTFQSAHLAKWIPQFAASYE